MLTMSNVKIPGRKVQKTPQEPLVKEPKQPRPTIHAKREPGPAIIKEKKKEARDIAPKPKLPKAEAEKQNNRTLKIARKKMDIPKKMRQIKETKEKRRSMVKKPAKSAPKTHLGIAAKKSTKKDGASSKKRASVPRKSAQSVRP